jgi:hypothetical protein
MTRMMETMLKHIIVFGVGSASKDFLSAAPDHLVVVALMDNDQTKHGTTVEGYKVVSPEQLARLDYDYIVVTARAVDSIRAGLMERGVPEEKIVAYCPSYSRELHERANRDIRVLNEQLGMTIPRLGWRRCMSIWPTARKVSIPCRAISCATMPFGWRHGASPTWGSREPLASWGLSGRSGQPAQHAVSRPQALSVRHLHRLFGKGSGNGAGQWLLFRAGG